MSFVVNSSLPLAAGAGGTVAIAPTLAISGTPPAATRGLPYSWSPTISGAVGNIRVSLDGGLPNGLSINSGTGAISGTPVTEQTINFGITVRDDLNVVSLPGLTLTVNPFGGGEMLPAIPTYSLTSTAYNFTSANTLEIADQRFLKLPTGASALPAITDDWFQMAFVTVDEMTAGTGNFYALASKGTSGHNISGNAQFGLNVRGGPVDASVTPYSLLLQATSPSGKEFFPGATRTAPIDPGATYLCLWGQKGSLPFFSTVNVEQDGRVNPVVFDSRVGAANDVGQSWKYSDVGGTTPAYTAGNYDMVSGFGGNVDVGAGGNRRNALGKVANYANVWGSFPFVNGSPDPTLLLRIANGAIDGKGLADLVGGTLRYANDLRGPGDLSADPRGTITAAVTEGGTNALVTPRQASPLRQTPELRLDTFGDGFVFGVKLGTDAGDVPFSGSFLGSAAMDSFEVRLVRSDNGAVYKDWTTLFAVIDAANKRFSGVLPNVTARVAFRREIRWRNRPQIAVRDGDRQTLGLLLPDVSQSQLAYQGYASNTPDAGGGANTAPTFDENVFLSVVKQPFPANAQTLGGGATAGVAVFQPYKAGQHGDGNIYFYETIKRLSGMSVMIVDLGIPGNHPNRLSYDRKPFSFSGVGTITPNAPDGATTTFSSITTACVALTGEGLNANGIPPGVLPGTLNINLFGVNVTDNGRGTLVGSGITAGTINYRTGVLSGVTFATAPASGATLTGTFVFFSAAPEQATLPQDGQWSQWGDESRPLDYTNRTGRTIRHLTRLRGAVPSMFRVSWYTSMDSTAGIAAYPAMMDRLKTRYDATYPAAKDVPWGFGMPTRATVIGGTTDEGQYKVFGITQRAYANSKGYGRVIGEFPDMELSNNEGPHQSPLIGSKVFGERLAVGVLSHFVSGLSVEGPVLQSARYTDANRNVVKLTFTRQNGTGLTTADNSTSGIAGIRIAPAGNNTYTALGFTAAITGANEVTLTKDSGSWAQGQKIGIQNSSPIMTGKANEAADNLTLLKMLSDNDGTYNGVSKYSISGRRGNPTRLADGIVISDAV